MDTEVTQEESQKFDINKIPPAIRAHMPGQTFTFSDGTEYLVQQNGSWKKTKEGVKGN